MGATHFCDRCKKVQPKQAFLHDVSLRETKKEEAPNATSGTKALTAHTELCDACLSTVREFVARILNGEAVDVPSVPKHELYRY